jgi:hypothetical protein
LTRGGRALAAGLVLCACGRTPEDKLVDWPPKEEIVPYGLPEVVDTAAPELPDTSPPDTAPVEVAPPPPPPCQALVDHACVLWTAYSDACREARTKVPDDSHPPTREACEALLTRFKEQTRWGNPCGRYARAVCAASGEASERCKAARARTPVLTERREWNACIADLLWFEARTFRR